MTKRITPLSARPPIIKRVRTDQELIDLAWRPQREYRTLLEACPTQSPEWWEGPPTHQLGTVWVLSLVALGLAGLLMLL